MLKVIYPNGTEIIYNDAKNLRHGSDAWHLYTKDGGHWICSIQPSAGVIVENMPHCSMRNKLTGMTNDNALTTVISNIKSFDNRDLKALRDKLKNYNFRSGYWKE
jgi:hypothetical protein